jgi:hypothetical protein
MRFDDVKTETLNLRVSPTFKRTLKAVAEAHSRSMVNMLEVILLDYCKQHPLPEGGVKEDSALQTKGKKAKRGES